MGATTTQRAILTAAAAISAVMLMGASSCDGSTGTPAGTTTPSATAQNLAIGKTLHVTSNAIGNAVSASTAFITVESVKFALSPTTDIGMGPKNGVYAVADVLIQVDSGQYSFNPLYVKYQEPDGTTYDMTSGSAMFAGFDPALGMASLSAGQKSRGNVAFDVKTRGGLIQLTDPLGAVIGQWTVPAS